MTTFTKFLGGSVAIAALAVAAPAMAQYFPGMSYPGVGYGYPGNGAPGYGRYGYGVNSQAVVRECSAAVQARLGGGYGGGYGRGGRVLGVSHVEPRGDGGLLVRGVASSGYGAYGAYGYAGQAPNLTWRCRTDFRGLVVDVDIRPAQPAYGYGYTPYNNYNDYSQYGYVRY